MRVRRPAANAALPAEVVYGRRQKLQNGLWLVGVFLIIWGSYLGCLRAYGNVRKSAAVTVILSDSYPTGSQVQHILDAEAETDRTEEICFYREAGLVTANEPSFGRQSRTFLGDVRGNAALFDDRIRGFLEDDQEGCIIDAETAKALFGSREAVGRELMIQERRYQVRSVINWKQPLILIHGVEKKVTYPRLFFECQSENKTDAVGQFLMKYGLSGMQADGNLLAGAAGAVVWILPLVLFLDLFLFAADQKKKAVSRIEKGMWMAGGMLLLGVLIYVLVRYCRIPMEWIPGKWSDFSFWTRRVEEEKEKLLYFFIVSRTAKETELLYFTISAMIQGLLSAVFYFLWIIFRKRNRIFDKSNKSVEESGESVL